MILSLLAALADVNEQNLPILDTAYSLNQDKSTKFYNCDPNVLFTLLIVCTRKERYLTARQFSLRKCPFRIEM